MSAGTCSWQGRSVLVTGAGGFIGSHLVERLVALGARTRAFVNYNGVGSWGWLDSSPIKHRVDVIAGDVCDPATVRRACENVEVVFHLAALIAIPYSYVAALSYVRTNVEGTLNLLDAARNAGVSRVVHTSTSEVFGTARQVPISESHPLSAHSPYAASKIGADAIVEACRRSWGMPIATIRPFNTYGPRQSARAVIPTIVTQALTQPAIRLGHLTPTRDFTFVADTVEAFISVGSADAAIGNVFNIGSGREISIGDLAATIVKLIGRDVSIVTSAERERPEASEVPRLVADASRARTLLGWRPRHDLGDGLQQTIDWTRANIARYRPEQYSV